MSTNTLGVLALGSMVLLPLLVEGWPSQAEETTTAAGSRPASALMVITGWESEIDVPRWRLASAQGVFDEEWNAHMGDRVRRAAQGWPMPPKIDFDACEAVFVFGGDGKNANGYRVMDVIEEHDAVTLRYERISYQTSSLGGPDQGIDVRPWAMILVPSTRKTIFLEENVQGLIGGEPVWKPRAAFPGEIGVGRPVRGTRQKGG